MSDPLAPVAAMQTHYPGLARAPAALLAVLPPGRVLTYVGATEKVADMLGTDSTRVDVQTMLKRLRAYFRGRDGFRVETVPGVGLRLVSAPHLT
jgi:hypothetical protein